MVVLKPHQTYSNQEMAEWFGTTESNFSKRKTKFLEKLKDYAEFEAGRGTVTIKRIFKDTYEKNKNFQTIKNNFSNTWSKTGLDSCARVSKEIYNKHHKDLTIAERTAYNYTCTVRTEFYGKPGDLIGGTKGTCKYIWCKKENGYCVPFSEKEQKIWDKLKKIYFPDTQDKLFTIQEMVENKVIKESEAWKYLTQIVGLTSNTFQDFVQAFMLETGVQPIHGTIIFDYEEGRAFGFEVDKNSKAWSRYLGIKGLVMADTYDPEDSPEWTKTERIAILEEAWKNYLIEIEVENRVRESVKTSEQTGEKETN